MLEAKVGEDPENLFQEKRIFVRLFMNFVMPFLHFCPSQRKALIKNKCMLFSQRDRLQVSFLVLKKFKQVDKFIFPLKSSEIH